MEEERNYTVYMHVNKVNNKTYIGITSQKPENRWGNDGNKYIHNEYFTRSIKKYGWDNFEHIILFENKTKQEAEELEILFIKIFLSNERKYGYNLDSGGKAGTKKSKETILKLSKALRGHKATNGRKVICDNKEFESITECCKYHNVTYDMMKSWLNCDCNMPEEFIDLNLRYLNDNDTIYYKQETKKVICDGEVFNTITDCANFYNIKPSTMRLWLNGINKTPKKFYDLDLNFLDNKVELECQIKMDRGNSPTAKKVICNGKTYDCIKDCAEYYNTNENTMADWLSGRNRMPQDFYDLGLKLLDKDIDIEVQIEKTGLNNPNSKKVICGNKEFSSIKECADYYEVKPSNMANWLNCRVGTPKKFIDLGLSFLNENTILIEQKQDKSRGNSSISKKVYCDGRIFDCTRDCADYYGINYTTMKCWLNKSAKISKEFYDLGLCYLGEEPNTNIYSKNKGENHHMYGKKLSEETKNKISNSHKGLTSGGKNGNAKKVICNGIIFSCIKDCAEYFNLEPNKISRWLKGQTKMPQEFKDLGLQYYIEEENENIKKIA